MKVYLAAPLFTPMECEFNIAMQGTALANCGVELCLPQDLPYKGDDAQMIQRQDLELLNSCDGVLALCNGAEIDSGTAFEIGYAYAMGKDILIFRNDKRPYFNAMIRGCMHHASTYDEIINYYRKLIGGELCPTPPRHKTPR